jgi:hypothetical protein
MDGPSEISIEGRALMASNSKQKTTFAKLNRENAVRERQQLKQARRAARKLAAQPRADTPSEPRTTEEQ